MFKSLKLHVTRSNPQHLADFQEAAELKSRKEMVPITHPAYALSRSIDLITGTGKYSNLSKVNERNAINSLIIYYGFPTLYLTISPADTYHFLAYQFLTGEQVQTLSLEDLPAGLFDKEFRAKLAAKNPVALAQFFNCYISSIVAMSCYGCIQDMCDIVV